MSRDSVWDADPITRKLPIDPIRIKLAALTKAARELLDALRDDSDLLGASDDVIKAAEKLESTLK